VGFVVNEEELEVNFCKYAVSLANFYSTDSCKLITYHPGLVQ
jgi:hypothetical protein